MECTLFHVLFVGLLVHNDAKSLEINSMQSLLSIMATNHPRAEAKKPCCWPDTMQTWVRTTLPVANSSSLLVDYSGAAFDLPNKRMAIRQFADTGKTVSSTLVFDYKNHFQYQISGKTCTKSQLTGSYPKMCINGSATFQLTSYLGAGPGRKSLSVDFWSVGGATPTREIAVTSKECAPVAYQENHDGAVVSMTFYNLTTKISDPSIFNIPPDCNKYSDSTFVFWKPADDKAQKLK